MAQPSGGDGRVPGSREAGEGPAPADRGLLERVPAGVMRLASPLGDSRTQRLTRRLQYALFGYRPEPVPAFIGPVEPPEPCKTGICCSGGGIRSAAYNLGALQSLQTEGELEDAAYLTAVSGGSYIAAAFAMAGKTWTGSSRPPDDPANPTNGYDDSDPLLLETQPPFAPGTPEEQYLRNRSSYLAPDGSAKLYLGARLLFGLLFNVFFLALPVAAVGVAAGLVLYGPTLDGLRTTCDHARHPNCGFHPPPAWWIAPLALFVLAGCFGAFGVLRRPRSDWTRRACEVWATRLLIVAAGVALVTLALPAAVDLVAHHGARQGANLGTARNKAVATGGAGLAGVIAGVLTYVRSAIRSPRTLVADVKDIEGRVAKLGARTRRALVYLGAAVAGPLFFFAVAATALVVTFDVYDSHHGRLWLLVGAAGALALFAVVYAVADLTSWSLHPFYKRRLCGAFALKRISPNDLRCQGGRRGSVQETTAGVAVERDFDRLVPLSETALDKWPALVVCAAANVSDGGATPPGRSVTSFTFSANAVGGPLVGGIGTRTYEHAFDGRRARDLSLPSAVAMSGAAIAPSMGKLTHRSLRFLLTLANIRLGVWVPNPRWVAGFGDDHADRERRLFGRPRPSWLVRELLGRNRIDGRYVYVTDGGHYENLGLVELLRRGCTRIYCFDASGGRGFAELGDAVALARSEVGVEIYIDPTPLDPVGRPPTARQDAVLGTFEYRTGERGVLVYARTVLPPGAPWDVRAHQEADPRFPHDSTIDQLYTDQKFESYRALGEVAGGHAIAIMGQESPLPGAQADVAEMQPQS